MVYLLGLGRFFLALGGLDTGSSFGGLGSSREMTISALAEPAMMLAVFTVAIGANDAQTVKAFMEAEAYDGPSLIIAYSHCIQQGIDNEIGLEQQ